MKKLVLVAIFFTGLFSSCSSDDDNNDSSNSLMVGTVQGMKFTAKGGKSFSYNDLISIFVTNDSEDNCKSMVNNFEYSIQAEVPKKVGTYNNQNVVFDKIDEIPLNVLQSTVIIKEITDTHVTVYINAHSSDKNHIKGQFTVPYCK